MAWPTGRLELRLDALARATEAADHPRPVELAKSSLEWGWDPCLIEAFGLAATWAVMSPLEVVVHEVVHASDPWSVGDWLEDQAGVPGLLVSAGLTRVWISAADLTARGSARGETMLTPWIWETRLDEGWTTARAQILAPAVRALIGDLPAPPPFLMPRQETPFVHPYLAPAAVLRALFSDDELVNLDPTGLRAALGPRLAARLGPERAGAIAKMNDYQFGPIARTLPDSIAAADWWPNKTDWSPLAIAFRELVHTADWAIVRGWLEQSPAA